MDFIENITPGSSKLTVRLTAAEREVLSKWAQAARIYPGAEPFDSDFVRFAWFKKYSGGSQFKWIGYGELGTLGGIPILGIPDNRNQHYIFSGSAANNVMADLHLLGWCKFVDIPSEEARVKARAAVRKGT